MGSTPHLMRGKPITLTRPQKAMGFAALNPSYAAIRFTLRSSLPAARMRATAPASGSIATAM